MKRFKEFINEGLLSAMKPMEDDKIKVKLDKMVFVDRMKTIKKNNLDIEKYFPSDDSISHDLGEMRLFRRISIIDKYNLDKNKFYPSDDEIRKVLDDEEDIIDRIYSINYNNLDKNKFYPSDDEIRKVLDDCVDVFGKIDNIRNVKLDENKFFPSDEEIREELDNLDALEIIDKILEYELNASFLPNDKKISEVDDGKVIDLFDENNIYYIESNMDTMTELRNVYNTFFHNAKEDLIESSLPIGIGLDEVGGEKCMVFNDWSDFSPLFTINDNVEYVDNILGEDGSFNFYGDNGYDGYSDVDANSLKLIVDKVISLSKELDIEYDEVELNSFDLDKLYKFIKGEDELDDIKNTINHAYDSAQGDADYNEAYNTIIDTITDKFNLDDKVKYKDSNTDDKGNTKKGFYYIKINSDITNILDFDEYLEDPEVIIALELDIPYYGFSGTIKEEYFSEQVKYRLSEI